MNYSALIQNRKSVREFTDREVSFADVSKIREFYRNGVHRLVPELKTELYFYGPDSREALEGAAGYNQFLVGAPQYLVLMSEKHPLMYLNAGSVMEDLILKLTDMGLDSCWVTFADSEDVKKALGIRRDMEVAAIAAFGYGKKTVRRLRLNIRSMSNVDIRGKRQYMEPKKSVQDLAYLNTWGNNRGLEEHIGFFDEMLWEALYAAALSPSYLNRQAYGFLLREGTVSLVGRPDAYNVPIDEDLSLGIALLHFSAVAETWAGKLNWQFGQAPAGVELPEGHRIVATAAL